MGLGPSMPCAFTPVCVGLFECYVLDVCFLSDDVFAVVNVVPGLVVADVAGRCLM